MTDDAALLRSYVRDRSEAAFAELVRRHLNLVYFAALRRTGGNAALAEDIAQGVFAALGREAAGLTHHPVLTGWLYTTTRNVALKAIRAEQRRKRREEEAHRMNELSSEPAGAADWERLRPLLDAALDELSVRDREAVLWRCWDGRAYAEIAGALRISEDAARMRVERALDRLRDLLAKRGLTSTSVAVAAALGEQAGLAAPSGLAAGVTSGALTAAGPGAAAFWAPAIQFMANSKLVMSTAAVLAVVAIGTATHEASQRAAAELSVALVRGGYEAQLAQQRDEERRALAVAQTKVELAKKVEEARATVAGLTAQAAARPRAAAAKPKPLSPAAEGRLFLARHPEAKAALIEWSNAQSMAEWASFIRELGLSPAQVEQFLPLVSNRSFDPGLGEDGKELSLEVGAGLGPKEEARRLRGILGADGYAKYEEFNRSLPERGLAGQVAGTLCYSETPLTPEQSQRLVQIMGRNRLPESEAQPTRFDWDGIIAQAGEHLSPPQLAVLAGMRTEDRYRRALDRLSMESRK